MYVPVLSQVPVAAKRLLGHTGGRLFIWPEEGREEEKKEKRKEEERKEKGGGKFRT